MTNNDKQNFIERTKQEWQPYYDEELTDNDAVEIIDNMTAFLRLLMKWERAEKEKQMNCEQSCKISNT